MWLQLTDAESRAILVNMNNVVSIAVFGEGGLTTLMTVAPGTNGGPQAIGVVETPSRIQSLMQTHDRQHRRPAERQ